SRAYSACLLDVLALGAQVGQDLLDAELVDDAQPLTRNAQLHVALLALEPEALRVQIRQEAAARLVVRMGNVIAAHRPLPRHLTNLRHRRNSTDSRGAGTIHNGQWSRQGRAAQSPGRRPARRRRCRAAVTASRARRA